ncbi:DUF5123 domain-containing protein [Rufibacter tibetensis]|uniref:DUF5123 domain-containing protein n=1 Tax=Rufibacter tibetensis TaxID=512763 RepID=A0A0P0CTZ8_9BACT|nr:DUF5123 domain-containing protein [Rufibacter tibetensis]ALJ00088.1 hypothetical protein DC20_15290 [Rufibacter tibetensis]
MKKFSSKIAIWFVPALLLLMGSLASCNPDDEEEQSQLSRMFMPTGTITSTSGESQVRLSWREALNVAGNITYTVEVAADTLFQTPVIYTGTTDTTSIVITDDNIPVRQKFFARIKTNARGNVPESRWLVSNGFTIRGVQIFVNTPVSTQDITDRSVRLRFNSRPGVSKVVVTPAGGTSREVSITQSHLTAGFVIVDGLVAGTNYTAEIFAGNKSFGVTTFQTKEPLSGNIIDLRGIVGRPSVLQDTITQVPTGSTIILKRGQTYTISSTTNLSKSVTITSGTDLTEPNLAAIYLTSNFNVVAGSNIDQIVFRDVNMSSDNATSKYVFNISNASTIGNMVFDNVQASKFRGIVRLQSSPTTITNFTVNNSVIDSIGSYGVINVDVATSQVQNIAIKNSTIFKAERIVTSRNNSTTVLLENLTINEAPTSGAYLVDYSTSSANNVSGGITIRNSILGIGKSGNLTIRGVRANASTLVQVVGTYATSDHVETGNPTPDLTSYNGTSLELWQDPKNGNFRFKDANFAGKATAGDPRWR